MAALEFTRPIEPYGPAAAITLSDAEVAVLGSAKTPPVLVEILDGAGSVAASARLRVARMGGVNVIGFSKKARADLGIEIGDVVSMRVSLDTAERTAPMPPELKAAISDDAAARAAWDAMSYTNRKEMAESITGAKREDTRARRLAAALDKLRGN